MTHSAGIYATLQKEKVKQKYLCSQNGGEKRWRTLMKSKNHLKQFQESDINWHQVTFPFAALPLMKRTKGTEVGRASQLRIIWNDYK